MRRTIFWLGWVVLCLVPIVFLINALRIEDVPPLLPYGAIVTAAAIVVICARNRDDVLRHHVA
jgi:hypothetical protein